MKRYLYATVCMAVAMVAGKHRVWDIEFYNGESIAWLGTRMETGLGSQVSITVSSRPLAKWIHVQWG